MDLMGWLKNAGVLFTTVMGIGQKHKKGNWNGLEDSATNDWYNGYYIKSNIQALSSDGPHVMAAMTFIELAKPESANGMWSYLETQHPNVFGPLGELNLVKESLRSWGLGFPV